MKIHEKNVIKSANFCFYCFVFYKEAMLSDRTTINIWNSTWEWSALKAIVSLYFNLADNITSDFWFTNDSVGSNNLSLKYQRFKPSGCQDIGSIKFEFVAKTYKKISSVPFYKVTIRRKKFVATENVKNT